MKVATLAPTDRAGRILTMKEGNLVIPDDGHSEARQATASSLHDVLNGEPLIAREGQGLLWDEANCLAPLPQTHTFLDGSAYVNHVALVRQARGAEMPERFWNDPLMYQGASTFRAPWSDFQGDPAWGIDFEGEIAVICGDVPMGATPDEAAGAIRFVMLLNDWSLRNLIPDELSKGFGFVQSKPPCACSGVAVTPDELRGWDGNRLHGTLHIDLNGEPFGRVETGEEMTFGFGDLISHAAKTRDLPAGAVIGSGTVSNRDKDGGPGRTVADGGRGYACLAEQRMVETIRQGAPVTPFLSPGDKVRIWYEDAKGDRPFGHLQHTIKGLDT